MTGYQWLMLVMVALKGGIIFNAYQHGKLQLVSLMLLYAAADLVIAFVPESMGE